MGSVHTPNEGVGMGTDMLPLLYVGKTILTLSPLPTCGMPLFHPTSSCRGGTWDRTLARSSSQSNYDTEGGGRREEILSRKSFPSSCTEESSGRGKKGGREGGGGYTDSSSPY